ncbi:hypothetical protein JCM11641_004536 [Rhodosporidiobolus odoratus]
MLASVLPLVLLSGLSTVSAALLAGLDTPSTTSSTLLPLVCTPDACLAGDNSLTAGILVTAPVNSSSQRISLLPGTYTPSSATFTSPSPNSSLSTSLPTTLFSKKSTSAPSDGFTSSGSLSSFSSSSCTVTLLPGLTAYTSPLYQGEASYIPLPTNYTSANSSSSSNVSAAIGGQGGIESLLLSPSTYAILTLGSSSSSSQRLVVWDSMADVGELKGGAGSGGVSVIDVQGTECATPCASGGVCNGSGKCICGGGWEGETCNTCTPGFFGRSCSACPADCKKCDDGLTGTGLCLDVVASNITLPSTCNCVNGECATASASAPCACNAGWAKASNGTQCAACAEGYYMSEGGNCLACDPSCASCSSPSGTCLTCQPTLSPSSSSPTICQTSRAALTNGTFITCPNRTYFSTSANDCVHCNPLCESCFGEGTGKCLKCRSPNVLLEGECVAVDERSGVCDASGVAGNGTAVNGGFVYDNAKGACDALPAKCTAGGIDSFTSSSTRAQLTCSACLPGSYLVDGTCVTSCPSGSLVSKDGLSCEACDSSCATCSISADYCTSCTSSSSVLLNGTCINGPSCPTGYFSSTTPSSIASNTSISTSTTSTTPTCLPCHPDCQTCTTSSQTCSTCPSSRPVLTSSSTCVSTCASTEHFDTAKSSCQKCSTACSTCSGSGNDACLSCPSGSRLISGKCVAEEECQVWVDGFGACLSDLVTVAAVSAASEEKDVDGKWKIPWWLILVVVLVVVGLIGGGVWWFRKRQQKRRRGHTERFARGLGDKEVDKKLAALPVSIAYPPIPHAPSSPSQEESTYNNIPLTPRFILEDPSSPISPAPSKSSYAPTEALPPTTTRKGSRWSHSSFASTPSAAVQPQRTGSTNPSMGGPAFFAPSARERTFTTKAGNTLTLAGTSGGNSRNPFLSRI